MGVITEIERQKYFAYLDGVADGLNESRNDVNSVLDMIRDEIEKDAFTDVNNSKFISVNRVNQIFDKYKAEVEPQESEDKK